MAGLRFSGSGKLPGRYAANRCSRIRERISAAAIVMAAACWLVFHYAHKHVAAIHPAKLGQVIEVFASIGAGISIFLGACSVFKVKELKILMQMRSSGKSPDTAETEAWKE